jgi:hypothetical protein
MQPDFYQVKVDEVHQKAGFIPVAQAPARCRAEPHIVGWSGRFTFYNMPTIEIAEQMNDWLIQENERLKEEVEEIQMELEKAQHMCDWQSGWEKGRV